MNVGIIGNADTGTTTGERTDTGTAGREAVWILNGLLGKKNEKREGWMITACLKKIRRNEDWSTLISLFRLSFL